MDHTYYWPLPTCCNLMATTSLLVISGCFVGPHDRLSNLPLCSLVQKSFYFEFCEFILHRTPAALITPSHFTAQNMETVGLQRCEERLQLTVACFLSKMVQLQLPICDPISLSKLLLVCFERVNELNCLGRPNLWVMMNVSGEWLWKYKLLNWAPKFFFCCDLYKHFTSCKLVLLLGWDKINLWSLELGSGAEIALLITFKHVFTPFQQTILHFICRKAISCCNIKGLLGNLIKPM